MDASPDSGSNVEQQQQQQQQPPITLSTPVPLESVRETTVTIEAATDDSTVPVTNPITTSIPLEPPSSDSPPVEIQDEGPRVDIPPPVQADPVPVIQPPQPELEHAYWADIEEDLSVPDEAEMKEIESAADGDYSAYECKLTQAISGGAGLEL